MEVTKEIIFNTNLFQKETSTITYKGYLFKANSTDVSIVYGYGDSWEHTTEQPMKRTLNGFVADIEIKEFDKINFCFKNSYEEWDNNNYQNYSAEILPPLMPLSADCSDITEGNFDSINEKADLLNNILNEYTLYFDAGEEFNITKFVNDIVDEIICDAKAPASLAEDVVVENTVVNAEISDIVNYELAEEETHVEEVVESANTTLEKVSADFIKELEESINYVKEEIKNVEIHNIEEIDNSINNFKNFEGTTSSEEETVEENMIEKAVEEAYTPVADEASLIAVKSNEFIVAARKLTPFYRFQRRVRLFFYKALHTLPKVLSGEYVFGKEDK